MDRIIYISRFSKHVSNEEIKKIEHLSTVNNARDGLTGALICFQGVFYQILEGAPGPLYRCFDRIRNDPRHNDIFILDIKRDIRQRQYPQWEMKTVLLDEYTDPLLTPIRNLLASLTTTHSTLKKYAPIEVLDGIQQGLRPLQWGMERDEMIVLFADLVGFSTLMENADIQEVQEILGNFFDITLAPISRSGGTVSKLLGDGFLAYFPITHASKALDASASIMQALQQLRESPPSPFMHFCYGSVGLSAGPVVMGNIGSAIKMDYTVLGDVVNSASRLEGHTRECGYSVLFDHRFLTYLPNKISSNVKKVGTLTPKGKLQALTTYTLEGPGIKFDKSPQQIAEGLRNAFKGKPD